MSRDPLDLALEGLETAAREVATQCYQWDQLARELWEELDKRYAPGGPNDWMGYYVERLRRYAPEADKLGAPEEGAANGIQQEA